MRFLSTKALESDTCSIIQETRFVWVEILQVARTDGLDDSSSIVLYRIGSSLDLRTVNDPKIASFCRKIENTLFSDNTFNLFYYFFLFINPISFIYVK